MNIDALFAELSVAPNMPAARCVGKRELFDATIEAQRPGPAGVADLAAARAEAVRVCGSCVERTHCAEWVAALPKRLRPLGVVAGRVHREANPRARRRSA